VLMWCIPEICQLWLFSEGEKTSFVCILDIHECEQNETIEILAVESRGNDRHDLEDVGGGSSEENKLAGNTGIDQLYE
jgi:hypothetical protein